jgi:hypothetical protein
MIYLSFPTTTTTTHQSHNGRVLLPVSVLVFYFYSDLIMELRMIWSIVFHLRLPQHGRHFVSVNGWSSIFAFYCFVFIFGDRHRALEQCTLLSRALALRSRSLPPVPLVSDFLLLRLTSVFIEVGYRWNTGTYYAMLSRRASATPYVAYGGIGAIHYHWIGQVIRDGQFLSGAADGLNLRLHFSCWMIFMTLSY